MFKISMIVLGIVVVGTIALTVFGNWDHITTAVREFGRSLPKVWTYRSGHGRHSYLNHQADRA